MIHMFINLNETIFFYIVTVVSGQNEKTLRLGINNNKDDN